MKDREIADRELVRMIRAGGRDREDAFTYLLLQEKREGKALRLLKRRGATLGEIQEVLHDALVALDVSIRRGKFNDGHNLHGYLTGIIKNLWNKKWHVERKHASGKHIQAFVDQQSQLSVEQRMIAQERRAHFLSVFTRLGESCKELLYMAFFEERKNAEMVELLGYKDTLVVSSKKSKCLRRLIEMLKETPELLKR